MSDYARYDYPCEGWDPFDDRDEDEPTDRENGSEQCEPRIRIPARLNKKPSGLSAAVQNIVDEARQQNREREGHEARELFFAARKARRLPAADVSYPTPPCVTCGEPVYLTVSGAWRHAERDYAHDAAPVRENGSKR